MNSMICNSCRFPSSPRLAIDAYVPVRNALINHLAGGELCGPDGAADAIPLPSAHVPCVLDASGLFV
jgi:hypothetical protein